jgi:hypothetical protein
LPYVQKRLQRRALRLTDLLDDLDLAWLDVPPQPGLFNFNRPEDFPAKPK